MKISRRKFLTGAGMLLAYSAFRNDAVHGRDMMNTLFRDDFATLDSAKWGWWSSGGAKGPFIRYNKLVVPFDATLTTNTVGVSTRLAFLYGKVSFRMKATATDFKTCPNLWPANGVWTCEVDIAEGPDRLRPTQTLHYGDGVTSMSKGDHFMMHRHGDLVAPGLADYRIISTEWTPGLLVFSCDGVEMSRIEDPHVPNIPMGVHLQVGRPGTGTAQSGEMVVDWVEIEQ